jgi:hypothetical protein
MLTKRYIRLSRFFVLLLSYLLVFIAMKRTKNLKITPKTHELLKKYCEENGLKMFAYTEKLIRDKCTPKKGLYDED